MKDYLRFPLLLILALASAAAFAAQKGSERAVGGPTATERAADMASLHAQLDASSPARVNQHFIDLSSDDLDVIAQPGVDDTGLFRVGLAKDVQLPLSRRAGDVEIIGVGSTVRLNIQVNGGTLYAWDAHGTAHSYTQSGWTHSFEGTVRVRATGAATVTQVGLINLAGSQTDAFCDYNASCVQNASCASVPPAIAAASDAVGHMLFPQGAYFYICSGALIADSDDSSQIPYFLTANHCISRNNVAKNLEVYFQYTAACNSSCGAYARPDTPNTLGATVVSTSRTGDYTLLQLDEPAPSGSVFLGWNDSPVANSNGTALYRLSHPKGAPQAYSEHEVDTSRVTCSSWPRGNWIYSSDIYGATEGGSSGSAVLNADGEIVGQLSGGCGYDVNNVCNAAENATVDGAFAAYYADVADILGDGGGDPPPPPPPGGCTDNDGDGYCAEDDDCDDSNSHVHPGHPDKGGRWGRDGLDNDCNGIIDG
jgi:V8-like Glu-specific endopeptidase